MCAIITPCRHDWPTYVSMKLDGECCHPIPEPSSRGSLFCGRVTRNRHVVCPQTLPRTAEAFFKCVRKRTWLQDFNDMAGGSGPGMAWLKTQTCPCCSCLASGRRCALRYTLPMFFFFCVDEFVYILKMSTVFATLPGLR